MIGYTTTGDTTFLGVLLDQGHELPPHQLGPLVARQIGRLDGRETSIFLQDYGQVWLVPLPGDGLAAGEPQPIDGSDAGRAFREARPVEVSQAGGVRVYLPLLDGGDQVGVMAVTLDHLYDDERRLLRRLLPCFVHRSCLLLAPGPRHRRRRRPSTTRRHPHRFPAESPARPGGRQRRKE